MRIVDNIRPDRQTVMFSATFPRAMEALARRILNKPLEIQVGGRSVVCSDVEQHVVKDLSFISVSLIIYLFIYLKEAFNCHHVFFAFLFLKLVIEEDKKFLKLLELLGHYQERGSVIIFVDKQEHADGLLKDLMKASYPCMSLHGGERQFWSLSEQFPLVLLLMY